MHSGSPTITSSYDQTPPTIDKPPSLGGAPDEVAVPGSVWYREVFGVVSIAADALAAAVVDFEIETLPSSGTFVAHTIARKNIGDTPVESRGFFYTVPRGCKYRFTRLENAGTTETITTYSFRDVGP